MGRCTPETEFFLAFLHKCFKEPMNRRKILMHWHTLFPKALLHSSNDTAALSDYFADFITTLLYQKTKFVFCQTHFTIFGEQWPIYRKWILPDEIWTRLEDSSSEIFKTRTQSGNGTSYVYESPLVSIDDDVFTITCRRQLIRDFCWLIRDSKNEKAWLNLILGIQTVMSRRQGSKDVWLSSLHQACQGKCDLKEVPCIL